MNIDKIEKMEAFPNFINYIKISIKESGPMILLFIMMGFYFFSGIMVMIVMMILTISDYIFDKKIFKAFENRKKNGKKWKKIKKI